MLVESTTASSAPRRPSNLNLSGSPIKWLSHTGGKNGAAQLSPPQTRRIAPTWPRTHLGSILGGRRVERLLVLCVRLGLQRDVAVSDPSWPATNALPKADHN